MRVLACAGSTHAVSCRAVPCRGGGDGDGGSGGRETRPKSEQLAARKTVDPALRRTTSMTLAFDARDAPASLSRSLARSGSLCLSQSPGAASIFARRDAAAFPRRSVSYTYTATYTYAHTYRIVLSALRIRRAARLCVIQIDRLRPFAPSSSLSLSFFLRGGGNRENVGLATLARRRRRRRAIFLCMRAATPPLISLIDNGASAGCA